MKEQIEKLYEKYRRGRLKVVIICVIAYFAMMGVVSMFLGSPFPHKTQILFMETMANGWINTHGYLLILCGIIGIIVGMGSILYQIIHDFEKFDKILLEECDTKNIWNSWNMLYLTEQKLNQKISRNQFLHWCSSGMYWR